MDGVVVLCTCVCTGLLACLLTCCSVHAEHAAAAAVVKVHSSVAGVDTPTQLQVWFVQPFTPQITMFLMHSGFS
jgi:hypothetical protein